MKRERDKDRLINTDREADRQTEAEEREGEG